jgi:hypothetical protein
MIVTAGLLALVIYFALPREDNEYAPLYVPSDDETLKYDITAFTEFDIFKKELYRYNSYDASLSYDASIAHETFMVDDTAVKIGDVVTKDSVVGVYDALMVRSTVNGRIVNIADINSCKNITILNADAFEIQIYVHQSEFYDISLSSTFAGVLPNGSEFVLAIKQIHYEVVAGYVQLDLYPQTVNYDILPGINIEVRRYLDKDECSYFISIDAFFVNGGDIFREDTYFAFVQKKYDNESKSYVFSEIYIKTGRRIGDMVGIYIIDDNVTLLLRSK